MVIQGSMGFFNGNRILEIFVFEMVDFSFGTNNYSYWIGLFFFLCKNNNNKILKRKVYIVSFRGMDC